MTRRFALISCALISAPLVVIPLMVFASYQPPQAQEALAAPAQPQSVEPLSREAAPAPKIARGRIKFDDRCAAAMARAQAERKPVMLFFTAEWCRFCNQMAQDAFRQDPVVGLSERFVCILVDADRQPEICQQYDVRSFPTVLFLDGDASTVGCLTGKQPTHRLVMEMQQALQAVARHADWSGRVLR